ncbi:hypothetical protein LBMAG53_28650 [Planctomycetota bacterium]|nr:hypothetical protein LBMAG53_28650 [Planctomycetota bacterium]
MGVIIPLLILFGCYQRDVDDIWMIRKSSIILWECNDNNKVSTKEIIVFDNGLMKENCYDYVIHIDHMGTIDERSIGVISNNGIRLVGRPKQTIITNLGTMRWYGNELNRENKCGWLYEKK